MSVMAGRWWPLALIGAICAILILWRCNLSVAPAVSPTPTAETATPISGPVVTMTSPPTITAVAIVPTIVPTLTPLPPTATSTATASPTSTLDVLPVQIVTPRPMPTGGRAPEQLPRSNP